MNEKWMKLKIYTSLQGKRFKFKDGTIGKVHAFTLDEIGRCVLRVQPRHETAITDYFYTDILEEV